MLPSKLLEGKVALITGCNRGIGKSILELYALNGASIWACARTRTDAFEDFISNLRLSHKVSINTLYFDLLEEEQIATAIKILSDAKTKIDILVNNAGIAHGNLLQMTTLRTIKDVFEINFFSQIRLIQSVSKIMMKYKCGSIINIASVAGIDALPGYTAYGSSKAALILATKTISKELALYNIRVNAVAPGLTETDMAHLMENKAKIQMVESSAMKRMARTEEIAGTVLFLGSDLSSFINGQVIRVDGGI
jgi:3-oxoacyl-[acyl-carrier protein] reductase